MGFGARICCGLLAGLALQAANADEAGEPTRTRLMVGQGTSVVVEEYVVAFPAREAVLRVRLPSGVDPTSLVIADRAGRARAIETRIREPQPLMAAADSVTFGAPAGGLRTDADRVAETILRVTDTRARPLDVIYTTTALGWHARYDLTVRGDITNYLEPLSADLEGRIFISNGLARTFARASILVRGPDTLEVDRGDAAAVRGFLSLDPDSPLADLWRPRPRLPRTPQLYAVPEAVTLPGGETVAVRVAAARRLPAERVFLFDGDRISTSPASAPQPLRLNLSIRNDRRGGLGQPLPPGWVTVAAGAGRASVRQRAQLNHTPAGGWIRVDMGAVPEVAGSRRSLGRTVSKTGFTEETVELRIVNLLPSIVRVEIAERPPAPLAWDVVRCSRPYEVVARRIRMEIDVPPRSEERISYTVRITEPES